MFVQVIQGRVTDAGAVRARLDEWLEALAPGAEGWLGTTGGVTDDGRVVFLVRFESEEAARRNSERPEQGSWWADTEPLFSGEPVFHDSSRVEVDTPGDPQQAGFVQVMQGRSRDPERARQLMAGDTADWQSFRPDVLGSLSVEHDGDGWTMAIYFTSEEAARAGERKQPPPEVEAAMRELQELAVGDVEYFDLTEPWLDAPR